MATCTLIGNHFSLVVSRPHLNGQCLGNWLISKQAMGWLAMGLLWNAQRKRAPFAELTLHRNISTMRERHMFDNGKPQTSAARLF